MMCARFHWSKRAAICGAPVPELAAVQALAIERRPELLSARLDLEVARANLAFAANVSYLDALMLLDQSVGTALDTWGVGVEVAAPEAG
jgi:hypothetical protein